MAIDTSKWHNTGGNGQASAEWVRKVGKLTAIVRVLFNHCRVDLWQHGVRGEEGTRFDNLAQAQAYADRFLAS